MPRPKRASSGSRLWETTWGLGRERSAVHPGPGCHLSVWELVV